MRILVVVFLCLLLLTRILQVVLRHLHQEFCMTALYLVYVITPFAASVILP